MLKIFSEPTLRNPALLCAFGGWADAATAASGAMRYLLLKREGRTIAEFDPDSIYVYTTTRPVTTFDGRRNRHLKWPELNWVAVEVPEAPRDLIVLVGPEPDLRWRECMQAIVSFAERMGVTQLLAFGAFLAQVHYAGPPALMGVSTDRQTRARLQALGISETNYEGPTSFVTALLLEATQRGIPAASLWVAAPNYLSNASNPKLSAGLLEAAEYLIGQELWVAELKAAGRDMERRIEEALKSRPDLAGFLKGLSGEEPPPIDAISPEPPFLDEPEPELPTAEEVLRDLEEHLRRLKEDSDGDEDDGPA